MFQFAFSPGWCYLVFVLLFSGSFRHLFSDLVSQGINIADFILNPVLPDAIPLRKLARPLSLR